jgi:arsenate reductase (thioredoxin)
MMNRFAVLSIASALAVQLPTPVFAAPDKTVVFVCEHGSSKSLVAAEFFNRIAEQRGLNVRAISRAVSDKTVDQQVPPEIVRDMSSDGFREDTYKPTALEPKEAQEAARVIIINYDNDVVAAKDASVEHWSGVSPITREYGKARDQLVGHIDQLLQEIGSKGEK